MLKTEPQVARLKTYHELTNNYMKCVINAFDLAEVR